MAEQVCNSAQRGEQPSSGENEHEGAHQPLETLEGVCGADDFHVPEIFEGATDVLDLRRIFHLDQQRGN